MIFSTPLSLSFPLALSHPPLRPACGFCTGMSSCSQPFLSLCLPHSPPMPWWPPTCWCPLEARASPAPAVQPNQGHDMGEQVTPFSCSHQAQDTQHPSLLFLCWISMLLKESESWCTAPETTVGKFHCQIAGRVVAKTNLFSRYCYCVLGSDKLRFKLQYTLITCVVHCVLYFNSFTYWICVWRCVKPLFS